MTLQMNISTPLSLGGRDFWSGNNHARCVSAAADVDSAFQGSPKPASKRTFGGGEVQARILESVRSANRIKHVVKVDRLADHELAGARVLYFDDFRYADSVYWPDRVLTDSYYDEFGLLPALAPKGSIGILGLGGGTIARVLLAFWKGLFVEGWEIDEKVVWLARKYFGLADLECISNVRDGRKFVGKLQIDCESGGSSSSSSSSRRRRSRSRKQPETFSKKYKNSDRTDGSIDSFAKETERSYGKRHESDMYPEDHNGITCRGRLKVHIGDALGEDLVDAEGKCFAGLAVDLFNGSSILPALREETTWQKLKQRVMPGGRIMINCGGSIEGMELQAVNERQAWERTVQDVASALHKVFPGEVSMKQLQGQGKNFLLLTGPVVSSCAIENEVPKELTRCLDGWQGVSHAEIFPRL